MSFKEVKELRQQGKLEEALEMAQNDLEQNPEDIWNKRSIAWVYYDYSKAATDNNNVKELLKQIDKIESLELPETEVMIFDTLAFQVGKILFALSKVNKLQGADLDKLFSVLKKMHFTKPSDGYSFLHKAFLKASTGWDNYCDFADWWGYENFQQSDYEEEEYNKKTMMSTVEQAYIHYAKGLTTGKLVEIDDVLGLTRREHDMERIASFLDRLDDLIQKHPSYMYPPYYKAKLLLLQGGKEKALNAFLPFAKQKKNDFWVWELIAEIFDDDHDRKLACYCKALSCKIPGSFLVKTRQNFAKFLIQKELYPEARFEIDQLTKDREANGWRVPNEVLNWKRQNWCQTAPIKSSNNEFYNKHSSLAESILFESDPEERVLITSINEEKHMVNYAISRSKTGFFNYQGLIKTPEVGNLYDVRISNVDSNSGFTKINTIKKSDELKHPLLKQETGTIRIKEGAQFGFVNDSFVGFDLLNKYQLKNDQSINVISMSAYNKKKNEWGWKVIKIMS